MGLEQAAVIDFIGIDEVSGVVHLTIADAREWDADHLRVLQEKLNAYLAFVESGELYSAYPSAARGAHPRRRALRRGRSLARRSGSLTCDGRSQMCHPTDTPSSTTVPRR